MAERSILVTGGAGYIGALLVPMLLDKGYRVHVVDSMRYGQPSLMQCFINPNFSFEKGDVRDTALMGRVVKNADAIIHLAALVGEPVCKKDSRACYEVNRDSVKLINDLRSTSQPLIFASTGSVYGKIEGVCTEESPVNPVSDYAIAKLEAEKHIREKGAHVTYRFATAFGLSPRMRLDLLINDFVYKAMYQKLIIVYEAHFKRTFAHVQDLARSFVFAVEHYDEMKNEVYNVGDESMNFTKEEIAKKIQGKVPYSLQFADFGTDPDQRNYEVSYEKVHKKGFRAEVDLERGVNELVTGYAMLHIPNPYSNVG